MDISSEVADVHMRTDAKNLVTTARTIHLPERKEACSRSIHVLAHVPTQNRSARCLTKVSAKAENLITAIKSVRLSDVDIQPNFRALMEHMTLLSTWCRTLMHTREKKFSFLNSLKISLSPTPREGPSHVMLMRNLTDSENQDASKKSARGDSRIYSSLAMVSFLVRTSCLCLVLTIISLRVSPSFSPSLVTMSSSKPTVFWQSEQFGSGTHALLEGTLATTKPSGPGRWVKEAAATDPLPRLRVAVPNLLLPPAARRGHNSEPSQAPANHTVG